MKKFLNKIVQYLLSSKPLSHIRKIIFFVVDYAVSSKNGGMFFYNSPEQKKIFDLIRQIKGEIRMDIFDNEAYQIYRAVEKTEKLGGNIAEVGIFNGGSSRIICEANKKRPVHLFDTFEGLPEMSENDDSSQFYKGQFIASFEDVKNYLKKYPDVYIYKGLFPSTAKPIENKKFSFVHLDVDIYEATLNCLEFFYSRILEGGVIISHDYGGAKGVRKAFDDFFRDKPQTIIEIQGSGQCLVSK